jgi:hypothetical protein
MDAGRKLTIEAANAQGTTARVPRDLRATVENPVSEAQSLGYWLSHLAVLQARFTGEAVRDFWELHRRSEAAVAARLGAKHGQG